METILNKINLHIKFIKFLIVGGLNTFFGYSVFALLIFLGLHYSLAVLISTVLGVLFNFNTSGKIVFENNDNRLLLKFIIVYIIIYLINIIGLKFLKYYNIDIYLAGALLIIPMAFLSYTLNKKFVFGK